MYGRNETHHFGIAGRAPQQTSFLRGVLSAMAILLLPVMLVFFGRDAYALAPLTGVLVLGLFAGWAFCKPVGFRLCSRGLMILYMLRRREIKLEKIAGVELIPAPFLRKLQEVEFSAKAYHAQLASEFDDAEIIAKGIGPCTLVRVHEGRPLLLTPINTEEFVEVLESLLDARRKLRI